jgi:microcystin synthetase protein McyJ
MYRPNRKGLKMGALAISKKYTKGLSSMRLANLEMVPFGLHQALRFRSNLKMLRSKDASILYTVLGDDAIETLNENFEDASKPLWLNLGCWKDAQTYPDACRALAIMLGETAELKSTDTVLDAGCGFGEQDALLVEQFGVTRIMGIDITPVHVTVGQERLRAKQLDERITLAVGSAVHTGYPDNFFDKVIALECAFHFKTREQFFCEAFRVLKPGGRLALTDMLPSPGKNFSGVLRRVARKRSCVPEENMYDRIAFAEKLDAIGFIGINVLSIAGYVYPGMARYIDNRLKKQTDYNARIEPLTNDDIETVKAAELWDVTTGISDYIIATACKP